jgi:hypothetical protein
MNWTPKKIFFAGCGGMLLLSIIGIGCILRLFFSSLDTMEEGAKIMNKERERIISLNTLEGVVVNSKPYAAPFSKDTAALTLLKIGSEITYSSRNSFKGGSSSRRNRPKWSYDYKTIVISTKTTYLKIGSTIYPIDFKQVVLAYRIPGIFYGHKGSSYATNEYSTYDQSDMDWIKKKAYIKKDSSAKAYLQNREALKQLHGLHPLADQYIEKNILEKKYSYSDIIMEEILLKNGDSIAIKGKIVNGEIVPLF